MRILTHNSLKNPSKAAAEGFPLGLEIGEMKVVEAPLNADFIRATLPGLDWSGLLIAARAVGLSDLPERYDPALLADPSFVQSMHTLLLEVHVETGVLVCSETAKRFPIVKGIPNMLCAETEV